MKIHSFKSPFFKQPSREDRSTSSLFFMFANSGMQIYLVLMFGEICSNKSFLYLKWKERGCISMNE